MTEDKILDRIRKLLAQAEDPSVTEAEAEAFNEKAAALIAQYGIDQAKLAYAGQIRDNITQTTINVEGSYSSEKAALLGQIASALRCRSLHYTSGRRTDKVTVVGFKSDLERVELLYTSLLLQATNRLTHIQPPYPWEGVRAYRASWLHGFRTAVYKRLTVAEDRAASQSDGSGTELVLVDRKTRVDSEFSVLFPKTTKIRRSYSGSGFGAGYTDGQAADIGAKNLGENRREDTR